MRFGLLNASRAEEVMNDSNAFWVRCRPSAYMLHTSGMTLDTQGVDTLEGKSTGAKHTHSTFRKILSSGPPSPAISQ